MKIDHVRLLVVQFAECFRFYRDVVGLKVKWGDENDTYASFAAAGEEAPNIALFSRQDMADALGIGRLPIEATAQDRAMLIIGVEDVDATVQRFEAMGVVFTLGPKDYPGWGMRSAYLRDPDGNLIELCGGLSKENWSDGLRQAAEKYPQT
jgi:catechol 2,3-dioxygenase-like lactoylglutathione lyase family enzyme